MEPYDMLWCNIPNLANSAAVDTLASFVFPSCSVFVPSKKFFNTTRTSEDFAYSRPENEKQCYHVYI